VRRVAGQDQRSASVPTDQLFQTVLVGGLDPDTGVQAKAATVIPREHVFGFVGLQEAVAPKVSQDSEADRVL
jgi:hypothetical protein